MHCILRLSRRDARRSLWTNLLDAAVPEYQMVLRASLANSSVFVSLASYGGWRHDFVLIQPPVMSGRHIY